jgi:hypothetical protein
VLHHHRRRLRRLAVTHLSCASLLPLPVRGSEAGRQVVRVGGGERCRVIYEAAVRGGGRTRARARWVVARALWLWLWLWGKGLTAEVALH